MATPDQVAKAHQRQLEAGWRRIGLRLPPEAAKALEALERSTGMSPGQIVALALSQAASVGLQRVPKQQR